MLQTTHIDKTDCINKKDLNVGAERVMVAFYIDLKHCLKLTSSLIWIFIVVQWQSSKGRFRWAVTLRVQQKDILLFWGVALLSEFYGNGSS